MNKLLHSIGSKLIKRISISDVVGKKIKGINKKLFYEPSQHLTFFFQKEIEYEINIQRRIQKYIKECDIIFDIGANIGQYALFFSELAGKDCKVYSFEPDFKNFSFLQFNRNINRCNNLHCYNYGIGQSDTELDFFRDTETGGRKGSFIKDYVGTNYKGYTDVVKLKKFDTLINEFGKPNFIKIDVEGFEIDVLKGLSINLDNSNFLIEVRKETKKNVFEYFHNKGFRCLCIDDGEIEINKVEEVPDFANLLFSKPDANKSIAASRTHTTQHQ